MVKSVKIPRRFVPSIKLTVLSVHNGRATSPPSSLLFCQGVQQLHIPGLLKLLLSKKSVCTFEYVSVSAPKTLNN